MIGSIGPVEQEEIKKALTNHMRKKTMQGLDLPKKIFSGCGFEDLPEYKIAVKAVENYITAVEKKADELYKELSKEILNTERIFGV